jgi:hypothetical protein
MVLATAVSDMDEIKVVYTGGYSPLPADLRAVVLELTRKQLGAMGVDLSALGGAGGAEVPIRAVSIGALRVEYAISLTASSSKGAAPAINSDLVQEFATVLDLYRSPRRVAAVPE